VRGAAARSWMKVQHGRGEQLVGEAAAGAGVKAAPGSHAEHEALRGLETRRCSRIRIS
jgi:hypothetical protein